MKKLFTFLAVVMFLSISSWAIPAKPGLKTVTQSDGTTLQIQMLGDEFHHSLATADRLTIDRGADGDFYYKSAQGITTMRAHDAANRKADEQQFLAQHEGQFTMGAVATAAQRTKALRAAARRALTQVPTMGSPRVPIILVQYTNKKMKNTKAQIEAHYKTDSKSAFQYFKDQSNGKYTPQLDIYGIYDLPNDRSYYGGSAYNGNDDLSGTMVIDAISKAGNDINWSLYDNDGDGKVDVCIVVYAGVGQAQAYYTVPGSVWPCQWTLDEAADYGDGSGPVTRNGVTIDKYAVFNEISGDNDSSSTLDGVGTFCHEFSHCLGLPDFYDTSSGSHYGMGSWSLMDSGCYNGGSIDGDTPIGYSAYEKAYMSWIDMITPVDNTKYTLPVFNSKSEDTDQAVKITALNENEYWILENRRQQGWDLYIPDEGVMISHFTYIADRWNENSPNNYSIQLATIIPADSTLSINNENKDLFGETNHAFTTTTTPAMKANMKANGSLASSTGGAGAVDKPVTEINLNSDGTASLWYNKGAMVKPTPQLTDTTDITSTSFTAHWGAVENVKSYTLKVNDVNAIPPYELILQETFPTTNFSREGNTDIGSSLDNYMDNTGWTGSKVYTYDGGIKIGASKSMGSLVSPTLSFSNATSLTVKLSLYPYGTDENVNYKVSYGDITQTLTATTSEEKEIYFDNVTSGGKLTIQTTASKKRIVISNIKIYAGDARESAQAPRRATEVGDSTVRTITGITDTSYTVSDLTENGLFNVMVKAVYVDDTEGSWSDVWQVQLHSAEPPALEGDINLDGIVDITDVNILINIILQRDLAENYDRRPYITDDNVVDISDVNAVINIILAQ
ncbi:MAG: M6 family metalloprotease domain-containing protein [Muribaculaceae bacterium]|nr:M6 family metalloprotease domain-containing protein [Muribaculaceae bacterium]